MRKTLLIVLAGLVCQGAYCVAGSVRGTAYDVDGRVVPDARVLLMADYVKQKEQQTGPTGEFRFDGVGPGRYEVQIKKGRMFIFQNTIIIEKPEQEVVIWAVLPLARMMEASTVSARLPEGVNRFVPPTSGREAGGQVDPAQPITPLRVPYPAEAVSKGIEGKVAVHARIGVDGTVSDPLVLASPHEWLSNAVLDSLAKARYRPMRLNGRPVACGIDILIEFQLTSGQP